MRAFVCMRVCVCVRACRGRVRVCVSSLPAVPLGDLLDGEAHLVAEVAAGVHHAEGAPPQHHAVPVLVVLVVVLQERRRETRTGSAGGGGDRGSRADHTAIQRIRRRGYHQSEGPILVPRSRNATTTQRRFHAAASPRGVYGSAWGFSERTNHSPCSCVAHFWEAHVRPWRWTQGGSARM